MITVDELLTTYRAKDVNHPAEKLTFKGVEGFDVYNISAPFPSKEKSYIAGRVELRDSEHSKVYFFKKETETEWIVDEEAPVFELQDPFVTFIDNELVFGGVEIFEDENDSSILHWRTVFYRGEDIYSLKRFFEGPMGMKDIRLKELDNHKLLVLTRPQGEKGGRGKIGATVLSSLKDLSVEAIDDAPLLEGLFQDEEWGGANEIHTLSSDTVGVLGHIAKFDENEDRHYYGMSFLLDLSTLEVREVKIIAERKEFLPGEAKRPDLEDVIFSGGLIREEKTAYLYAGISDAEAQRLKIEDPFKQ